MSIPALQYNQDNNQYLQIGPVYNTNNPGTPLTGATVTATLYFGRNMPSQSGVAVPGATGIVLADQGAGMYSGLILASALLNPVAGNNYVTAIDLSAAGGSQAHWEIPSSVSPRQQ